MRFADFLNEHGEFHIDAILQRVELECAPFLGEVGKVGLWRGLARDFYIPRSNKVTVAVNRPPTHTDQKLHELADDWFFDNFGFRARSNALFASGNINVAAGYGQVHAVYPVGTFEYVWSPEIEDLYYWVLSVFYPLMRSRFKTPAGGTMLLKNVPEDELRTEFRLALDHAGYTDKDLQAAVNSSNEIMIKCDKYYAFSMHDPVWQQWADFNRGEK